MALVGLALSGVSRAGDVEERLSRLEDQVRQLSKENAELRTQLGYKGAEGPVLVRPGASETTISVGGFLQGDSEFGHAADGRFTGVKDRFFFRRARVYVSGSFPEDFDFKAELDLQGNTLSSNAALNGNLARGNEIYINWHHFALANLRFGQLKPAFGYEALFTDNKMLMIERYLANDRLIDGRNLSVAALGSTPDSRLTYYAAVANGNGSNVSGNDNSKFQKSVRITGTPYKGKLGDADSVLSFGVNGLWTEDVGLSRPGLYLTGNLFTGKRSMWGVDSEWTVGGLLLEGELIECHFRPIDKIPLASFYARGWQGTAAYFVVPGKLQVVVRRESFDPNRAVGGEATTEWVSGLNYFIRGDDIKLQADYIRGSVPGATDDGGRLLTRVQVIF